MSRFLNSALIAVLFAGPAAAQTLGLGHEATPEDIAVWNIDVRPDGMGLPAGGGNVAQGEEIFETKCASCHGDFGEGAGRWPVLAGGQDSLTNDRPVKTIGSYWPYLSTVYDYVNRAMPFGEAQSLEPDEVYAITAYLLYLNDEVDDDFELSSDNFADQRLPNEAGFKPDDRPETELAVFAGDVCMENCKASVEITMRSMVLDVTPEETAAKAEAATTEPQVAPVSETITAKDFAVIEAGEKVFRKCKACHQIGEGAKNRSGPVLTDVMDRAAGTVDEFKYSKALIAAAEAGLVWDEEAITAFLTKPANFMKGTKMSFPGLRDEGDIQALIAYLRSPTP